MESEIPKAPESQPAPSESDHLAKALTEAERILSAKREYYNPLTKLLIEAEGRTADVFDCLVKKPLDLLNALLKEEQWHAAVTAAKMLSDSVFEFSTRLESLKNERVERILSTDREANSTLSKN